MVVSFFALLLLFLAGGAMIATTVLGLLAIRDIRSSGGRIVGLPLALGDAMLFPLLILDVLIVAGALALCSAIQGLSPKEALLLSIPLCLIVDGLLIRWAWRSLSTTPIPPRDAPWALPHQPVPPAKVAVGKDTPPEFSGSGSMLPAVLLLAALLVGAAATVVIYLGAGRHSTNRLTAAASGGDGVLTARFLDSQPEFPDERNAEGQTPLSVAAMRGDTPLVRRLLQRGPEIDTIDIRGETPLIKAAASGHSGVVSALLSAGAAVAHSNAAGETALTLAAAGGHLEIVRELIEYGADPNHATSTGETALSLAVAEGMRPRRNF